jgi:hypothetical protein
MVLYNKTGPPFIVTEDGETETLRWLSYGKVFKELNGIYC